MRALIIHPIQPEKCGLGRNRNCNRTVSCLLDWNKLEYETKDRKWTGIWNREKESGHRTETEKRRQLLTWLNGLRYNAMVAGNIRWSNVDAKLKM